MRPTGGGRVPAPLDHLRRPSGAPAPHRRADVADLFRDQGGGGGDRPRRPGDAQTGAGKTPAKYGPIPKGTPYDASDPKLGLWVLATLADSALVYYERIFGALAPDERERYWSEYRQVGELLGLPPDSMPATHGDLKEYVDGRLRDGSLWISDERREIAVRMILEPPYSGVMRAAVIPVTETIRLISTGLLPPEIRRLFGFSWDPGREALLRSALLQLRLGSRFWLDAVRLHPAARAPAGDRYGTLAA